MIGTDEFEDVQFESLKELVVSLLDRYPDAKVKGHRDFPNVKKLCPGFDVKSFMEKSMEG